MELSQQAGGGRNPVAKDYLKCPGGVTILN